MAVEEQNKRIHGAHVVVLPFPGAGHVNPMLHFAQNLCSRRISVTFLVTRKWMTKIRGEESPEVLLRFEEFAYGIPPENEDAGLDTHMEMICKNGPESLKNVVQRLNFVAENAETFPKVSCIVYDSYLPWVVRLGIPAAFFWTQSWASFLAYHFLVSQNLAPFSPESIPEELEIKALPRLTRNELPSLLQVGNRIPNIMKSAIDQFKVLEAAKWVIGTSFGQVENQELEQVKRIHAGILSVGPLISPHSSYSVIQPWKAEDCRDWLASREPESVIYVAFGSYAEISKSQSEEFAKGLLACGYPFLWVIRPSSKTGECNVPQALNGLENEKGMIVQWCSQTEVLSHPSVGVFLSHCGWNSVLEGLIMGVPIVGFPQWSDQRLNVKYIEERWKMGISLRTDEEEGLVMGEEIEKCLRFVMETDEGKVLRKNAHLWRQRALEDGRPGGSADNNTQTFITELC